MGPSQDFTETLSGSHLLRGFRIWGSGGAQGSPDKFGFRSQDTLNA